MLTPKIQENLALKHRREWQPQGRALSQEEGVRPPSSKPSLASPKPECVPDALASECLVLCSRGSLGLLRGGFGAT